MNEYDIAIIKPMWEEKKSELEYSTQSVVVNINSSKGECCYIKFGYVDVNVFAYVNGELLYKTIRQWKHLSFSDFLNSFDKTNWKEVPNKRYYGRYYR